MFPIVPRWAVRSVAVMAMLGSPGCGPAGPGEYAGVWDGSWGSTLTANGVTTTTTEFGVVMRVEMPMSGEADMVMRLSGPALQCDLLATRSGPDALILEGQFCTQSTSGGGSIRYEITTGSASVFENDVSVSMSGTVGTTGTFMAVYNGRMRGGLEPDAGSPGTDASTPSQ
jgi:hypothetical protein